MITYTIEIEKLSRWEGTKNFERNYRYEGENITTRFPEDFRLWHFCITWVFIISTVAHIYLGSTGSTVWDYYKSMLTGWEKAHSK